MKLFLAQGLKTCEMFCTFTLPVNRLTLTVYIKLIYTRFLTFKLKKKTAALYLAKFMFLNYRYATGWSENNC